VGAEWGDEAEEVDGEVWRSGAEGVQRGERRVGGRSRGGGACKKVEGGGKWGTRLVVNGGGGAEGGGGEGRG